MDKQALIVYHKNNDNILWLSICSGGPQDHLPLHVADGIDDRRLFRESKE